MKTAEETLMEGWHNYPFDEMETRWIIRRMEEYANQFKQTQPVSLPKENIFTEVNKAWEKAADNMKQIGEEVTHEQKTFWQAGYISKAQKQTQPVSSNNVSLTDHAISLGTIIENGELTSANTDNPVIVPVSSTPYGACSKHPNFAMINCPACKNEMPVSSTEVEEFTVLTHCGKFVDENMLPKGIYMTSRPNLHPKDFTIENMIEQYDKVSHVLVLERAIENIKKCKIEPVTLHK